MSAVLITVLAIIFLPYSSDAQDRILSEDPFSREDPAALGTNLWAIASLHVDTACIVGDNALFKVTRDWGYQWEDHQDIDSASTILLGITLIDSNTIFAVGHNGVVLQSLDGGTTWIKKITDSSQTLFGVSFSDHLNGTITGDHGLILRTSDSGTSWFKSRIDSTKFPPLLAVSLSGSDTGTAVGGGGTILRTTDGGLSWVPQTSGVSNYLYGVSFVSTTTGTVVGTKGTILRTTNGGLNWTKQTLVIDTAAHLTRDSTHYYYAVSFQNDSDGIAVGSGGRIIITTNGGSSWIVQPTRTINNLYGVTFLDTNRWIAVGGYGTIIIRNDTGIVFTKIREYQPLLPSTSSLGQNYPNPFNPTTTIPFILERRANVTLKIFDILGRCVSSLLTGIFEKGKYSVDWNATDHSSGVYYYRLEIEPPDGSKRIAETRKLLLLK